MRRLEPGPTFTGAATDSPAAGVARPGRDEEDEKDEEKGSGNKALSH